MTMKTSKNWIAIIPARSKSKRLKHKNVLPFKDSTLLEHAVQKAVESKLFSSVYISTDSNEYEELAILRGAKSLGLRSEALSTDTSSTKDVIVDILNNRNCQCEGFTLIQCTSPFTSIDLITNVTNKAYSQKGSCISVRRLESTYLEWIMEDVSGNLVTVVPDSGYARSQDCRFVYSPTGNVYASDKSHFLEYMSFSNTEKSYFWLVNSEKEMLDIDTRNDYYKSLALS